MTVIMVIMALAVVKLNNVTKTQLVNRTGQTLRQEKWSVSWKTTFRKTECVGQQTVVVKMTSGVKRDRNLQLPAVQAIFWCSLQSGNAGSGSPERCRKFSDHKRLFHGPERGNDRFCGTLSAGIVPGRRSAGRKRCSGTDLYLWSHSFIYLPVVYMGYSPSGQPYLYVPLPPQ